jgi:photosystem II stability/assembly factor-like uncharacterized protein
VGAHRTGRGVLIRAAAIAVAAILALVSGSGPVLASAQDEAADLRFVRMPGPLAGWAVTAVREPGPNMLLRTADGGIHWEDVTPSASSGVSRPAVLTALVAWVEASTLLHTTDGGRTWTSLGPLPMFHARGNGALFPVPGSLDFLDERNGWRMMAAGVPGGEEVDIHRTEDGGATWVRIAGAASGDESSGIPFAGTKTGVTFLSTTTGWLTGHRPGCGQTYLFVTRDGGHRWGPQRMPPPPTAKRWNGSTFPPVFFSIHDGVLPVSVSYAVKDGYCEERNTAMVFYITRDGGATWSATTPIAGQGIAAWNFADMAHGWVVGEGGLSRTTDGARRWTTLPLPRDYADIHQLEFVSPQVGWAVRGSIWTLARTPGSLLKTVDGGQTWAPVSYTISRP